MVRITEISDVSCLKYLYNYKCFVNFCYKEALPLVVRESLAKVIFTLDREYKCNRGCFRFAVATAYKHLHSRSVLLPAVRIILENIFVSITLWCTVCQVY